MTDLALWIIKILRALPHTARFDRHLTDCAALAVVYGPFADTLERLRPAHVLRLTPLPNFLPFVSHMAGTRVPINDARFFLNRALNTLH